VLSTNPNVGSKGVPQAAVVKSLSITLTVRLSFARLKPSGISSKEILITSSPSSS